MADLLGEEEEFLWPDARRRRENAVGATAEAELIGAYPHRADLDHNRWWELFTRSKRQVDLLGYTLYFLPQQHTGLVDLLASKCHAGCSVRIAIADPDSPHVLHRDDEEQEPITLVARIHSSLRSFQRLMDCDGAEMRFQDAPLYNSIFRFDDEMLVTPHLYGTPGHAAPLLHLRRLGPDGIFARFAAHFEGIWSTTRPIDDGREGKAVLAGTRS